MRFVIAQRRQLGLILPNLLDPATINNAINNAMPKVAATTCDH